MCSERDSPLEPFVLPAPGQPELARLICGTHLSPPVLTRKQKRPRVNSLVCDRAATFCAAGPSEVLSRMSRLVTQAAEPERELVRARSQRLKQAARSLPGESVSRGFAGRGALEGYPSHYTSLVLCAVMALLYLLTTYDLILLKYNYLHARVSWPIQTPGAYVSQILTGLLTHVKCSILIHARVNISDTWVTGHYDTFTWHETSFIERDRNVDLL